uniref:Putative cell-division protein n=1 Tax=Arthrobacter sp. 68b TaxID=311808 RepID=A0A0F7CQV8_9MICC|nr:putative cell-division protein [Arthrobacter sp. 68b]
MDFDRVRRVPASRSGEPSLLPSPNARAGSPSAPPTNRTIISFDNVTKIYDAKAKPALDNVSFNIQSGEFVILSGPSGAGKSTILRLIQREERATTGVVSVEGRNVGKLSRRASGKLRQDIGSVTTDPRLLPDKNVFSNVAYPLVVFGKQRHVIREMVPAVLKTVGLEGKESRMPHELSTSDQLRVAIARAIVNKPKILLADEPTNNLDPSTAAGIFGLLDEINWNGLTVVMATHSYDVANRVRQPVRVIALRNGVLLPGQGHQGDVVAPATSAVRAQR